MASHAPDGVRTAALRFALSSRDRDRLAAHLRGAVKRARRSGQQTLASISVCLDGELDPSAVVCGSRRAGEPWYVFEHPERGRAALAGLGAAVCLEGAGGERFGALAERWRELCASVSSGTSSEAG